MEQRFHQEEIFARVRQEDRLEARQEGFAEGQAKTMVSNLWQLMRSKGWSAEQALTALGMVGADRQKYDKLLGAAH